MLHLLLLLSIPWAVLGDEPGVILTRGEHFDDTVWDATGRAYVHTLLIIYHNRCPPEISFFDLPSPQHLLYFTYGVENTLQYTWFKLQDSDDLHKRYNANVDACQSVLLFKQGSPATSPPLRWSVDTDLAPLEWVWEQIKVKVNVRNFLDTPVVVESNNLGIGPQVSAGRLEPREVAAVPTYPGHTLSVRGEGPEEKVILNMIVHTTDKAVTIGKETKATPMEDLQENDKLISQYWFDYQRASACRHLANMKQPLMLPRFTETGYEVVPIPAGVHKDLLGAFMELYNKHEPEDHIVITAPFVYQTPEAKSNIIELSERGVKQIAEEIRPLVEKFTGSKLRFTSHEGIRENYAGDRIFKHVTDIGTQVIGVLLQIEQDLVSDDWSFVFVTPDDGLQSTLKLSPGDMLIFESARLIHGRPEPFKGHTSSDITLYYAPAEGWNYVREGMDYVNLKSGYREPLGNVVTDLTAHGREPQMRDEL